jgi:hypothetical protein
MNIRTYDVGIQAGRGLELPGTLSLPEAFSNAAEEEAERWTRHLRFDIHLLADRLEAATTGFSAIAERSDFPSATSGQVRVPPPPSLQRRKRPRSPEPSFRAAVAPTWPEMASHAFVARRFSSWAETMGPSST